MKNGRNRPAHGHQGATRKVPRTLDLRVPVTPHEKARIVWDAGTAGVPMAAYLRDLGLGRRPRAVLDFERTDTSLSVGGDVGRFGGLLKLWLTNDSKLRDFGTGEVRELLRRVQDTESALLQFTERAMGAMSRDAVPVGEPFVVEESAPRRARHIHVPAAPQEAEKIRERAARRRSTVANHLRTLGVVYRPLSWVDGQQIIDLQVEGEALACQGRLLKLWLTDSQELRQLPRAKVALAVEGAMRHAHERLESLRFIARRTRRARARAMFERGLEVTTGAIDCPVEEI